VAPTLGHDQGDITPVVPNRRRVLHVVSHVGGDGTATTSPAGLCATCASWVGDDPNDATNIRFSTTYEH
jgi:hypothetical protein